MTNDLFPSQQRILPVSEQYCYASLCFVNYLKIKPGVNIVLDDYDREVCMKEIQLINPQAGPIVKAVKAEVDLADITTESGEEYTIYWAHIECKARPKGNNLSTDT